MLTRLFNLFPRKQAKTTFISNSDFGAYDLVTAYNNTDATDDLQTIVARSVLSEDAQHTENSLTLKCKSFELQRVDTFSNNITLSVTSGNIYQSTTIPADEKNQPKIISDFFKSKGVSDHRSLGLLSRSNETALQDELQKYATVT